MAALRFEFFTGATGLDRLHDDWVRLAAACPDPGYVHLWAWHRAYVQSLARSPDCVRYGVFYDGRDPIAIFPLQRDAVTVAGVPMTALTLPQHDHVPHADVLVRSDYQGQRLLATLEHELSKSGEDYDVLVLASVLDDSNASALLATEQRVLRVTQPVGHSDALPTTSYTTFLDGLSKNFRSALRKARNKLERSNTAVTMVAASTPDQLTDAFERFLALEASGWKGQTGTGSAIALDPALRGFYSGLVERLGPTGALSIHVLMIGSQAAAAQFAIVSGQRCYLLKIAYDETHAGVAPGNLLLERVLQKYESHPAIKHVDLVSNAAWHTSWKPVVRDVHTHMLFRRSPRGLLAWSLLRGKGPLKRLRAAFRR